MGAFFSSPVAPAPITTAPTYDTSWQGESNYFNNMSSSARANREAAATTNTNTNTATNEYEAKQRQLLKYNLGRPSQKDLKTPYNCLIVSHNNRIQCLVKKIYRLIGPQNCNINQQINSECEKIRFQNAAILKLTIYNQGKKDEKQTTYAELTLFYQGELEDAETNTNPYFVSDIESNIRRPRHFFKVAINSEQDQIQFADFFGQDIFKLLDTIGSGYDGLTFYIVRHGRAWHNVTVKEQFSKGFGIEHHGGRVLQKGGWTTLDTDLTPKGVKQAVNASNILKILLGNFDNPNRIQYVFVSDLARTFQTAFYISKVLEGFIVNPKFIVLPCSNETQNDGKLNRNDNIDCDTPSTITGKTKNLFNQENFPGCKVENGKTNCETYKKTLKLPQRDDPNPNDKSNISDVSVELDWTHYLRFYNNQMRTGSNTGDCNNTNMFQEAIKILRTIIVIGTNTYDSNSAGAGGPSQGGRRRSRKNKKMSNKRISKKRLNKRISKKRK
uniref:Uncharacterized protein n=1 Tax=viral metagenome TaxID=1070528 RepID=A0A6C0IA55_9ZZZZ